ncbi:hypothetical protein [Bacteroides sp.]|uniref:hypothetical protein n=1 Tax=Bacteroides sp. TaxID=29523 RepID=UPI0025C70BF1|nr:hypothetical protein [Bacteroides sp.]
MAKKYAMVIDESIMINGEKLFLLLDIPADYQGRAVNSGDATVLHMEADNKVTGNKVCEMIGQAIERIGSQPEYIVSNQGHNLINGIAKSGISHHADIMIYSYKVQLLS